MDAEMATWKLDNRDFCRLVGKSGKIVVKSGATIINEIASKAHMFTLTPHSKMKTKQHDKQNLKRYFYNNSW